MIEKINNIDAKKLILKMLAVEIILFVILGLSSSFFSYDLFDKYYISIGGFIVYIIWALMIKKELDLQQLKVTEIMAKPKKANYILDIPLSYLSLMIGSAAFVCLLLVAIYSIDPNIMSKINLPTPEKTSYNYISTFLSFVTVVIFAPIIEEIVFRGILLRKLITKHSKLKAIMISSFVFLIMHFSVNPTIFFAGVSLAFLTLKYNSLIPSILLHVLNNAIAFFSALNSAATESSFPVMGADMIKDSLIIGVILAMIYVLYFCINYVKIKKEN